MLLTAGVAAAAGRVRRRDFRRFLVADEQDRRVPGRRLHRHRFLLSVAALSAGENDRLGAL